MEVIQERRQAKKTLSRPKSAPTNQLYRSQGSIDSDFVAPEYFDDDTSNNVSKTINSGLSFQCTRGSDFIYASLSMVNDNVTLTQTQSRRAGRQ